MPARFRFPKGFESPRDKSLLRGHSSFEFDVMSSVYTIAFYILCPIIISKILVPCPKNLIIILLILHTTIISQQHCLVQWHLSNLSNVHHRPRVFLHQPGPFPKITSTHFFQRSWKPGSVRTNSMAPDSPRTVGILFYKQRQVVKPDFKCQTDGFWSEFSSTWMEFSTVSWTCCAWIIHFHCKNESLNLT